MPEFDKSGIFRELTILIEGSTSIVVTQLVAFVDRGPTVGGRSSDGMELLVHTFNVSD